MWSSGEIISSTIQEKEILRHTTWTFSVDVTIWTAFWLELHASPKRHTHLSKPSDSRQDVLTCPRDRSRTPLLCGLFENSQKGWAHTPWAVTSPPSKRHGNTLYHVFPLGCIPMLCQVEESGDSIGSTSFVFFFQYEGWIVHEELKTGQGALEIKSTDEGTCLCASTSWQCTAREREYALKKQSNRAKSEGAQAAQHEKWQWQWQRKGGTCVGLPRTLAAMAGHRSGLTDTPWRLPGVQPWVIASLPC